MTRATPSGTHAEGGAVDLKKVFQAFTAIRLSDSPKEYKQLFNSATVATDLPKGSPAQVMKVALALQVDSFNLDVKVKRPALSTCGIV
eukprot:4101121-Amphidinium_carterae.1